MEKALKGLGIYFLMMIMEIKNASGYNILLLVSYTKSHMINTGLFGEELVSRGHDVTIVHPARLTVPEQYNSKPGMKFLQFYSPKKFDFETIIPPLVMESTFNSSVSNFLKLRKTIGDTIDNEYLLLLDDVTLMSELDRAKFDFIVADKVLTQPLVAYRLGVPWGMLGPQCMDWEAKTPNNPSYLPFIMSSSTDRMSFKERLFNLVKYVMTPLLITMKGEDNIAKYIPEKAGFTYSDLLKTADLCLILKVATIDFPRPLNPNMKYAGGIMARPAKSLEGEVLNIVTRAKHGVILFSFGSWLSQLPQEVLTKFSTAFGKLKQVILWKISPLPKNLHLPENVKVMKWLPQNDLLAHDNVKALVSSCGINSLIEAVNNGVPIVCFPFLFDQFSNSAIIRSKKFGLELKIADFTPDELVTAIEKVIKSGYQVRLKQAAQQFQDLVKSEPGPSFWIEHVIQYGGSHLRPHAQDMIWYEYLMLDIAVLVITISSIICWIAVLFIRKLYRLIKQKIQRKKKSE